MLTQLIRDQLGLFLAMALSVAFQDYRIPNDRGGVGASGTIGRGTTPGEKFVPVLPSTQPAPTWIYVVPSTPAQPAPALGEVAPPVVPTSLSVAEASLRLPALARANPYSSYHRGWVHGYWNARLPDSSWRPTPGPGGTDATPGKGLSPVLGIGLGWGLPAWSIGPMAYSWGYFPYNNPFLRGPAPGGADRLRFDDYSRPIGVLNPPPTETLFDEAILRFERARESFRRGDSAEALRLADEALQLMPDDPMMQQFRALSLFSLRRYDEAAATLHSVLAVSPGWDWLTLVALYGDRATYTRHLRLLESATREDSRSAAAPFVLAYHYLSTGYDDEAVDQWTRVLELRPDDALTAGLIRELRPTRPADGDMAARMPETAGRRWASGPAAAGEREKLAGTWIARPAAGTAITVTFRPQGRITWKVAQPGREREFNGFAILEQHTLSLSEDEIHALVGTVQWHDGGRFTFRALAARADDPGLRFAKNP